MNSQDHILELVIALIEDFDTPKMTLSGILRKAIRIAQLRGDYDNLLWLELEMVSKDDAESRKQIAVEYVSHYSIEDYKTVRERIKAGFVAERSCRVPSEDGEVKNIVCGQSIPEIEDSMQTVGQVFLGKEIDATYVEASLLQSELRGVLSRIRQRVYKFLLDTEQQVRKGKYKSDIFEANRKYVHSRLEVMVPQALEQLESIYKRAEDNVPESRSQALISCRRLLKTFADNFYPAKENAVICEDGKKRDLSEDKYVNRLWMYITNKTKNGRSRELLCVQTADLGSRLDGVYNLSNKGVHASISEFEMTQCIMQTYLLIGDILRISDDTSAIGVEGNII